MSDISSPPHARAGTGAVRPRKVVIVGGGTSGWIAASMLAAAFCGPGQHRADITLIESLSGRIAVGEGTFPTLRSLLRALGINERDFMIKTDASFKQGIQFVDWVSDAPQRRGEYFYHPFEAGRGHEGAPIARDWAERFDRGEPVGPYAEACGFQPTLMDLGRAPKRLDHADYNFGANYAYHVDAVKLADFLADHAIARGVTRLIDKVVDVALDDRGWISAVTTAEHGTIAADLFVDCSGFQGLLINRALGVPFDSLSDILLCDRAVALRARYQPGERIKPYTEAVAQPFGWIWGIGLTSRRGTGYVYASSMLSDDAAEQTLREFAGPGAADEDARILPMRVGHCRQFWKNNCVAIGLAGGFLEPLEATGIYMIECASRLLVEYFPFDDPAPILAERYNQTMRRTMLEALDFINLHYLLSQRRDTPFWRAVTEGGIVTESLRDRLALWAERPPSSFDTAAALTTYQPHSWDCILYGMGWRPRAWGGRHALQGMRDVSETFQRVRIAQKRAAADLPDHMDYLRHIREAA